MVIGRLERVAVLLLLADEGPLLVELDLARPRGKSHELVMSVMGVLPGDAGQSDDGVAMDADEASGGADAAALVEVLEHRVGLLLGQMAAVERRAFAFGEAGPTGVAVELSELLVLAVEAADREVAEVAPAVEHTVGILAAEAGEVVHEEHGLAVMGRDGAESRHTSYAQSLTNVQLAWDTTPSPRRRRIRYKHIFWWV
jgi:hypothetical protein